MANDFQLKVTFPEHWVAAKTALEEKEENFAAKKCENSAISHVRIAINSDGKSIEHSNRLKFTHRATIG